MEQHNAPDLPIKLKSPTRFVLVGPGLPAPSVIVASSDDVSDLAGYYSIREAGFGDIMDYGPSESRSALDTLLRVPIDSESMGRRYGSVDVWIRGQSDRKELFSLIFDQGQFQYSAKEIIDEFSDKLRSQIERLVEAYKRQDLAEVQYVGQIISTFMSVVSDRIEYRQRRRQRRERLAIGLVGFYIAIIIIGGAIVGLIKFVGGGVGASSLRSGEPRARPNNSRLRYGLATAPVASSIHPPPAIGGPRNPHPS